MLIFFWGGGGGGASRAIEGEVEGEATRKTGLGKVGLAKSGGGWRLISKTRTNDQKKYREKDRNRGMLWEARRILVWSRSQPSAR